MSEWTPERIAGLRRLLRNSMDAGLQWTWEPTLDEIERLQALVSELRQEAYEGSVADDAIGCIREILADPDAQIPCAAFVDDHVRNLLILYKDSKARDQRRALLLRYAVPELRASLTVAGRELADTICAELGDAK
jgi:hypothetical protein